MNSEQVGVAVTLKAYIKEVLGSNLVWETAYSD
jgi:hypothetical protein